MVQKSGRANVVRFWIEVGLKWDLSGVWGFNVLS
jgi:hypothetical protein